MAMVQQLLPSVRILALSRRQVDLSWTSSDLTDTRKAQAGSEDGEQSSTALLTPSRASQRDETKQSNVSILAYAFAIIHSTPFVGGSEDWGKHPGDEADKIIEARASQILVQFDPNIAIEYLQGLHMKPDERLKGVEIMSKVFVFRKGPTGKITEDHWDWHARAITEAEYCMSLELMCWRTFQTNPEVLHVARNHSWEQTLAITQIRMDFAEGYRQADEGYWAAWIEYQARKTEEARKAGKPFKKTLEVHMAILFDNHTTQNSTEQIAEDANIVMENDDDIDMS